VRHVLLLTVLASLVVTLAVAADAEDTAVRKRGDQPRKLTPELLKKYDKNGDGRLDEQERTAARAERRGGATTTRPRTRPDRADGEAKTSIGQLPLTEMTGADGGLYGNGRNEPPEALAAAAKKEIAKITPLDANGKPATDGKIVLLAIGMSNTTREFSAFQAAAAADKQKSSSVVLVDGAQGGQAASEWLGSKGEQVWARADARLQQSGVTTAQVQAVWLKQAIKQGLSDPLENAQLLRRELTSLVQLAKTRYPNLRIIYLSSRSFGGYSPKHGEPESFDTGLSVRWIIENQQAGKAELNYDPARGEVKAPVLVWGPYLWADGDHPRKSDGLTWVRDDFVSDGTHPSESGQAKVVGLLTRFFQNDPLAKPWYVGR
jgi:hypothetical protein